MYKLLIYLFYIAKDLAKKNESYHGGAARSASSGMAFVIENKSSPPHVRDGLIWSRALSKDYML